MKALINAQVRADRDLTCHGAALLVVLVLITMICLLPLAFFLQSSMQRRLANSSSAIAVGSSLAEGAIESILSDLENEITFGSVASYNVVTNVVSGMVYTNPIYYPLATTNAIPVLAGSTGTNGLENLIKRSASGVASYSGASNRAIASSSTSASGNGFSIPIARWNKHLLVTRASPNSSSDVTPINSFIPPDWILIARDGSNPTNWSTSLRWSATNTTTVVGRYAYAMYDEGGLLDANVAGYPTALASAASSPVAGKSGPYFADLHQIGLNDTQINALVGWRNYVTAQASGSFPSYTLSDSGVSYAQAVFGNGNGFMATFNTNVSSVNTNRTDHQFSSRQQLIAFLIGSDPGNIPSALNALRYLGNYSRELNQPSFAPSASRPRADTQNNPSTDDVNNPAFLSICVNTTNFVRNNGATASVGDPLVKKRFPLNALSWLTYAGPSSTLLSVSNASYATVRALYTNAGVPQTMLNWGTPYNIANYFGLSWNSNGVSAGSWTYRNGSNQPIMTLTQVSATGRDPDFFELIKAAVTYGSLGKSYATNTNSSMPEGYNATLDNWTDAQIIQIGANIIDQFDFDSYPTRIQFSDGSTFSGASVEIRGVEDLPYLYRVREGKVMTADSSPSVSMLPKVTNGWSSTNQGSGVVLQEPEIWNPHAMRTNTTTAPVPTSFRLLALSTAPLTAATNGNLPTTNFTIGTVWIPQSGTNVTWTGTSTNLNSNNATLSFTIPTTRQDLFREPTLLIKPNIPNGCNLSGPTNYNLGPTNIVNSAYQYGAVGVNDNRQYTGIQMGVVPMAMAATFASNAIATGAPSTNNASGVAPTGYVTYQTNGSYGYPAVTYLLQYQDLSTNWITYDEKYTYVANATNGYVAPSTGTNTNSTIFKYNQNKTFYVDSNNPTWSKNAIGSEWSVVGFDPRSSRFGMIYSGCNGGGTSGYSFPLGAALGLYTTGYAPLYTAGWAAPIGKDTNDQAMQFAAQQNAVLSVRPDEYAGMVMSSLNTGPTAPNWFPGNSNSVVRPGMFVQNNPNITNSSDSRFNNDPQAPTFTKQYFADDDGVVRRGMSAFVPFGNSIPAVTPSANNPSGIPMQPAYAFDSAGFASAISSGNDNSNEYLGRPVMLNHPFRSVAELGVVFSGIPWRNLDCSTPESGGVALMDVFCINDTSDSLALIAGKVNLNTRQIPVLQAILAGAYKDEFNFSNSLVNSLISSNPLASAMAQALVARTHGATASTGPLMNISELVGKWYLQNNVTGTSYINGSASFVGFSDDQTSATTNDVTAVLNNASIGTDPELRVQRLRDATIRALSSSGQTRVWNLMIDLVVQSGRFPSNASGFGNFMVDGEVHYWIHLAIDRLTGQVIDRRVETLKE